MEEKLDATLEKLYAIVKDRQQNPVEGSYTNYLFQKGLEKICKKVGEESFEVVIAAGTQSKAELVYEISDLLYHLTVLMVEKDVSLAEIAQELEGRR